MKKSITKELALERGMRALTSGYTEGEKWLLEKAIGHLEKAGTPYEIVETKEGLFLYRSREGFMDVKTTVKAMVSKPQPGTRCL